jgi:hypothetical protein
VGGTDLPIAAMLFGFTMPEALLERIKHLAVQHR